MNTTTDKSDKDASVGTKGFYAYGAGGTFTSVYPLPTSAAAQFFRNYPAKRKCNVQEVEKDNHGGWVSRHCLGGYGVSSRTWKGVTPKTSVQTFYSVLLEIQEANKAAQS